MLNDGLKSGSWLLLTPLKNDGLRQWVSDDIPYEMDRHKIHVPKHQLDFVGYNHQNDHENPLVNSHITMERSTISKMGQFTISMTIFNSFLYVYQRVLKTMTIWILLCDQISGNSLCFFLLQSAVAQ